MRYFIGLVAIIVFCFSAHAQDKAPNAKAAQSIIEQQINAFLSDDAAKALSFAAPGIQSLFPSPDVFMSMVQRGYSPVFRPQTFQFGKTVEENGLLQQIVRIEAQAGGSFEALYTLVQLPDGAWKIASVELKKLPDIDV